MKSNERNYIERLRKRQEDALEYIVDKYIPLVRGTICKVLGQFQDNGLIEECTNDVFLSIWNNIDKFKGETKDFSKWIFAVSKFKAIDYYRTRVKEPEAALENIDIAEEGSAEDELINFENKTEVLRLLNDLEPMDRDIFVLKYLLGYKSSEIAARLDITKASVDNRIYRGKRKLKVTLLGSNLEVI